MKRVLIVIDGSPNDAESLSSAVSVCQATGATLICAHARHPRISLKGVGDMVFAADESEEWSAAEQAARAAFDGVCAGLQAREFRVYDASAETVIASIGHAYDLVVVERVSEEEGPQAAALNAAIFDTGSAALVAPPHAPATAPRHAAIAWNATAQSARALKSALPLMTAAEQVTLLLGSNMDPGPPLPIADYLRAYGIEPEIRLYNSARLTARGRGRALLAAAQGVGADLLVTGAYGEPRQYAIGGLGRSTRKVVTGAPIPVLVQS